MSFVQLGDEVFVFHSRCSMVALFLGGEARVCVSALVECAQKEEEVAKGKYDFPTVRSF